MTELDIQVNLELLDIYADDMERYNRGERSDHLIEVAKVVSEIKECLSHLPLDLK